MGTLLAIVGPTAVGKTRKALSEAALTPSIVVSADSRQVYRGMDIVTGKDHPKDSEIHGINIVDPNEPCSVAVWYAAVMPWVKKAWQQGKQVIVVGGTGLYVRALTEGIATMQVPINQTLRDTLSTLSLTELQVKLESIDHTKLDSLNHSDAHNPRRLIRAIEVAIDKVEHPSSHMPKDVLENPQSVKIIGIKPPAPSMYKQVIQKRVMARIKQGAVAETQSLLTRYDARLAAMSAIGYQSIAKYLAGAFSNDAMIDAWVADEIRYAKRQMTWFRKQSVIWYDTDEV